MMGKQAQILMAGLILLSGFHNRHRMMAGADADQLMVVAAESVDDFVDDDTFGEEEEMGDSALQRRIGRQYEQVDRGRGGGTTVGRTSSSSAQSARELVSDIHCMRTPTVETFTAFLRLPQGFSATPVLEESLSRDGSGDCLITETTAQGIFALDLSQMAACGVKECREELASNDVNDDGDMSWLCVVLRFPTMAGLKLPEDEVIEIKCKPQDRLVEGRNAINFQEDNIVQQLSPTIYLGGGQDFLSEIGLFRKLAGTELFASRVRSGSTIEFGEHVQLRSIVRGGDGWNFARISDVLVHRVRDGAPMRDADSTVRLVGADGCRAAAYRSLAPRNPWRDPANPLIVNFDFRVFMFQAQESGDAIMITANVVACVEEIDCAPVRCGQDTDSGYGRRKRSVSSPDGLNNSTLGSTKAWEENLELKIKMPPDLDRKEKSSPQSEASRRLQQRGLIAGHNFTESECKLYLIITLSVALTFCVLSAIVVLVACIRKCQESRHREKRRKQYEAEQHRLQAESNSKQEEMSKVTNYLTQQYVQSLQQQQSQQQQQLAKLAVGVSSNKPVTVRSVKRRDKAKTEEKQQTMRMQQQQQLSPQHMLRNAVVAGMERRESSDDDEKAVMV